MGGAEPMKEVGLAAETQMAHTTTSTYQPGSVASAFERARRGENPRVALGDFLDDWQRTPSEARAALVVEPIAPAGRSLSLRRWAAYFAATVEQLCALDGIDAPGWVSREDYRLDEPWFLVEGLALRALLLVTTPVPFKRRNIYNGESSLTRV